MFNSHHSKSMSHLCASCNILPGQLLNMTDQRGIIGRRVASPDREGLSMTLHTSVSVSVVLSRELAEVLNV